MAKNPVTASLAPEIRRQLAALRWRIRGYVLIQGLAVAVIWLILTFWAGLALDYLPVLLGANEMPRVARGFLLAVIGIVLAVILYRWILRRTFVPLADRSMAVLLERQFGSLGESLITSVELHNEAGGATPVGRQMLAATQLQALRNLKEIRVSKVLNLRPLTLHLVIATALGLSLAAFYVVNANAFGVGAKRIYLLDNRPWPRNSRIEVVGVESTGLATDAGSDSVVPFSERQVKVARGASVSLLVRADGDAEVVPEVCTITYRTSEGDRGRVNMTRVGQIRDGYQSYRYDGKPFKGVLADIDFDVLGFDHRVTDYRVQVVASPTIVRSEVDCVFPDYMVDEQTSSWLPRTVALSSGTRLPKGTQLILRAESNKPLREIRIVDSGGEQSELASPDAGGFEFSYTVGELDTNVSLDLTLVDTDNVISDQPYRVFIEAIEDLPPAVNVRLRGVGTAITPEAIVSLSGDTQDDYGVDQSWVELLVNDGTPTDIALPDAGGDVSLQVDFRQLARDGSQLQLKPEDTLRLAVKAQDRRSLADGPQVGVSDTYQLDVVTAEQLLSMLESRELGLRQRFEQIIGEMKETRDSLIRIRSEGPETVNRTDSSQEGSPGTPEERIWSIRLLRAQRAVLQAQKSAQETLGVAASFRDICEELVNNRVDSEDRQQRLREQVAAPLELIGQDDFSELETLLLQLVATMDEVEETQPFMVRDSPVTIAAADSALQKTNSVLLALDGVLQSMMRLEDYNELLDLVRALIEDQEQLIERTKQEQKRQVLELFGN